MPFQQASIIESSGCGGSSYSTMSTASLPILESDEMSSSSGLSTGGSTISGTEILITKTFKSSRHFLGKSIVL